MTGAEMIMAVAVILGPLSAVVVARCMESRRVQREQRMYIFRTLMRTRGGTAKLSVDHVTALNLVEIEFRNDKDVYAAGKDYFKLLRPLGQNEHVDLQTLEKSLAKLLQLMSRTLGYKIEGLDIFDGDYTPRYWDTSQSDAEWQSIRQYVIALSKGDEVLPVKVLESTPSQKDR